MIETELARSTKMNQAIQIVKQAVELDEGTWKNNDTFVDVFTAPNYPIHQIHLVLNQSGSITEEVLKRHPDGRLAQVVKRNLGYLEQFYEPETAREISRVKNVQ